MGNKYPKVWYFQECRLQGTSSNSASKEFFEARIMIKPARRGIGRENLIKFGEFIDVKKHNGCIYFSLCVNQRAIYHSVLCRLVRPGHSAANRQNAERQNGRQ